MGLHALVAHLRRADARGRTDALVHELLLVLPGALEADRPLGLISVTRSGVARVASQHGLPGAAHWRADLGSLPGAEALREGATWCAEAQPQVPSADGQAPSWPPGWPTATLGVPLFPEGALGGALYAFGRPRVSTGDRQTLELVAEFVSVAMERDRYRTELRRSDLQLTQLLSITAVIGRELDFATLAQHIVDRLTEVTDFRVATITLREDGTCHRLAAAGLPDPRVGLTTPSSAWEGLTRPEWRRGTISYLVPPEAEAAWSDIPDIAHNDDPNAWNAHHALVLTLVDGDDAVVGYLSVDEPRSGRLPTERSIEGLELFARQVQVAFVNAQLYTRLRQVADRDSLTGLHNRRVFWEELGPLLDAASEDDPLCLAVLDVDDFKLVNDAHGHAVGDDVLRHVADRLQRSCRESDRVYRIGGEEFVVVLPSTPIEEAHGIIDRARAAVRTSRIDLPALTLSAGIAAVPQHAATPDALFAAADAALYRGKREGKDVTALAGDVLQHPDHEGAATRSPD